MLAFGQYGFLTKSEYFPVFNYSLLNKGPTENGDFCDCKLGRYEIATFKSRQFFLLFLITKLKNNGFFSGERNGYFWNISNVASHVSFGRDQMCLYIRVCRRHCFSVIEDCSFTNFRFLLKTLARNKFFYLHFKNSNLYIFTVFDKLQGCVKVSLLLSNYWYLSTNMMLLEHFLFIHEKSSSSYSVSLRDRTGDIPSKH